MGKKQSEEHRKKRIEVVREFHKQNVFDVHMRHFQQDLGHEDSTIEWHRVPRRLFKITDDLEYPCVEHPVLQGEFKEVGVCDDVTIFHLAYIPNLWELKKRYENHLKKSNMHTPQFLKEWYFSHLFGAYPKKEIRMIEIPPIILREFGIDPDEIYFATHNKLEVKHFIMMHNWLDYFLSKYPEISPDWKPRILDMGCGWGIYGYVAQMFGANWHGIDKSEFACRNSMMRDKMKQGDILEYQKDATYDIVLLIDILEHLEEKDLDKAMENMKEVGDIFIFSIPFEGDSNLRADPTHKIFKNREWWIEQLSKYLKISDAPKEWMFSNQILIGEKK